MDWINKDINLGAIKEKTTAHMIFQYLGDVDIYTIKPSCPGCTNFVYNEGTKELLVEYSPGKLPKHLKGTFYHVTVQKTIQITYVDGTTDILTFSAKVIK